MPQNKPMKRQFTTIDGRTVMSNLPQHWGGNDWTITGVDNPLPVGNYVQTEAGVWIPQKGSDDGAVHTQLTGSNVVRELLTSKTGVSSLATVEVGDFNITNCKVFRILIIGGTTGTRGRIRGQWLANLYDLVGYREFEDDFILAETTDTEIAISEPIPVVTEKLRLYIDNTNTLDNRAYRVFIYKVE